jgi:hypothetical protein
LTPQGPAQSGILADRECVSLFLHFTVNPKPPVGFLDVPRCSMTGKEQGPILQNSVSSENVSDKFSSSNFGRVSVQKSLKFKLIWVFHTTVFWISRYLKVIEGHNCQL